MEYEDTIAKLASPKRLGRYWSRHKPDPDFGSTLH